MKLMEKAPAKINLALDVLFKRPDQYHEVEMVMTTVDLADRIEIEENKQNNMTDKSIPALFIKTPPNIYLFFE